MHLAIDCGAFGHYPQDSRSSVSRSNWHTHADSGLKFESFLWNYRKKWKSQYKFSTVSVPVYRLKAQSILPCWRDLSRMLYIIIDCYKQYRILNTPLLHRYHVPLQAQQLYRHVLNESSRHDRIAMDIKMSCKSFHGCAIPRFKPKYWR